MNNNFLEKIVFTLEKLSKDERDFSRHTVYGTVKPADIPNINFSVSAIPPVILNQVDLDFCSGFSASELNTNIKTSSASLVDYLIKKGRPSSLNDRAKLAVNYGFVSSENEYLEMAKNKYNANINLGILSCLINDDGEYFDPLFQFAKIKQVRGEFASYGANLRDAMQSLQKYGSIKNVNSPFTYYTGTISDRDRNFLANWNNWPKDLDANAALNKIGSFFAVDGPYDAFDNIRSILWKNFKSGDPSGVLFGLEFKKQWAFALDGVVKDDEKISDGGPHAVYLRGQKIICGVPYIVLQNSWGIGCGNKGEFYLPRNVINVEFAKGYGAFVASKIPASSAKYYNDNQLKASDNWLINMLKLGANILKKYAMR